MARRLFGTDGIRGVAGEYPLDVRTVYAFGRALGAWAGHGHVLIGIDSRESGPPLAALVAAALAERGTAVLFTGVTTTPAVAYLTAKHNYVAGLMISASHNPYRDNGLKVFDREGYKLSDAVERDLEHAIFDTLSRDVTPRSSPPEADESLDREYLQHLAAAFQGSLAGRRVVLDCANGGASWLAPELFRLLGADVVVLNAAPDGRNINAGCGALHPEAMQAATAEQRADFGFAFDGDADRVIAAGASGQIIDGDRILLLSALHLAARGALTGNAVVATVMSNLGLERALAAHGIALRRTAVGDRYVLEEMIRSGLVLGGEQSGHVIFRNLASTGDGLLTALRVTQAAVDSGQTLEALTAGFHSYPQKLVSVRFRHKRPLEELPEVQSAIRAAEAALGNAGRVNVRFSGTEPLARVMVEAGTLDEVELHSGKIAAALAAALG